MEYLLIAALVYIMIRYIEPIIDVCISWIQTEIQIKLQYKSIHLQRYSESFDVKESAVGFDLGNEGEDFYCPQDCVNCPLQDECDYYGEFLDEPEDKMHMSHMETPICKVDVSPTCKITKIGFIQD